MSGQTPLLIVDRLVAGYEPGLPIVNGASITVAAARDRRRAGAKRRRKIDAHQGDRRSDTDHRRQRDIRRSRRHAYAGPSPDRRRSRFHAADRERLRFAQRRRQSEARRGILPRTLRADRIAAAYETFPDLARQRALPAGRLSGGQRQMLAIARALLVAPKALMLDEPSAGLSPKLVEMVFVRLAEIRRSGVAIVLVEQNTRAALALADRAYILVQGRNRHEGRRPRCRAIRSLRRSISAASKRKARRDAAGSRRRADVRRADRPRRDRRHAHLFDPEICQFRPRRIHFLRRLCDAARGVGDLGADRGLGSGDRPALDQSGGDRGFAHRDGADRRPGAGARQDPVLPAARQRRGDLDRDGEFRRLDGDPRIARIRLHLAPCVLFARSADRKADRLRSARDPRPDGAVRRRGCASDRRASH